MHLNCSRSGSKAYVRVAICCCGLLMLAGCSNSEESPGKLVPVQGKITLSDGTPLPGGRVLFFASDRDPNAPPPASPERNAPASPDRDTPTSVGQVQEDGSYTLSTKGHPGAPLGKYRVVLARGAADRKAWSRVPTQYVNPRKSPLEVEVADNKPEGGYDLKLQPRSGRPR
jgi:hypothetical protein